MHVDNRLYSPLSAAVVVVLSACFIITAAHGDTGCMNASGCATLLMQRDGRLKPFDTYARMLLLECSGRQRAPGYETPTQWLLDALCGNERSFSSEFFLVNNPDVADALGIPLKKRRASYSAIYPAHEKLMNLYSNAVKTPRSSMSAFDREVVRLSQAFDAYVNLANSLSCFLPDPEFTVGDSAAAVLECLPGPHSYLEMLGHSRQMVQHIGSMQKKNQATWNETDMQVGRCAAAMYEWDRTEERDPLKILPDAHNDTWKSPWETVRQLQSSSSNDPGIRAVAALIEAYREGDRQSLDKAVGDMRKLQATAVSQHAMFRARLEVIYNSILPFTKAKFLYLACLAACGAAFIKKRWFLNAGITFAAAALLLHTAGIAVRIAILHRPPLGNMYEMFVFVSWTTSLIGLIALFKWRSEAIMLCASLASFALLHVAGKYGEWESMGMLSAVLNSNFWLTTHVVTIAFGYSGCCMAGIIAHVYILKKLAAGANKDPDRSLEIFMYVMLAAGWTFTVIGTVLGGFWADRSWGRFWGWDPKENGALAVILWFTAILHCRASGLIKFNGMAFGSVAGIVLVMCAWIGVNLLGIGMHSYGFTSSGLWFLLSYIATETVFVTVTGIIMLYRRKKAFQPLK